MISSLAWVPAGVADPHPKKYEMSSTEKELLKLVHEQEDTIDVAAAAASPGSRLSSVLAEKIQEQETKVQQVVAKSNEKTKTKQEPASSTAAAAISQLPADLRMDEYSSDDDDDEEDVTRGNMAVGRMLMSAGDDEDEDYLNQNLENEDQNNSDNDNDEEEHDVMDSGYKRNRRVHKNDDDDEDESDDDDDEDDLADVPDTREFMPTDVEALEAMGMGRGGGAMDLDIGAEDFDDDDSEAEDVRISQDDAMIVVAKTEEDFASLEVHVYDTLTGNLYVHHDIPLPSFPLCLAHGQVTADARTGNFCAVGSFNPGIEIWNLDVLNALEPTCILGGDDTTMADELLKLQMLTAAGKTQPPAPNSNSSNNNKKNKKNKKKQSSKSESGTSLRPGSHTDAVMTLSWNSIHKQVLASGSADCTVKLWDVTQAVSDPNKCNAATFTHHSDKVQSVRWHPNEGTLLATTSYDRTVALLDARSAAGSPNHHVKTVKISSDPEAMAWDPHHPELLTVATEDGTVSCWDVRKFETATPLWSFVANEFGGINDLSYNPHVKGMLATCSIDKTVALWDTCSQNHAPAPSVPPVLTGKKDMCSGKLFTCTWYPSTPWLLASAGSGNQLALWDMSSEETIQRRFKGRVVSGETSTADAASDGKDSANDDTVSSKEADFEAMMAPKPESAANNTLNESSMKKKKKSKDNKKKVHRKGR